MWSAGDIALIGRSKMGVSRTYNSYDPVTSIFGNGWSSNIDISLYPASSNGVAHRVLKDSDGKRYTYVRQADGSYKSPPGRFDTVTESATGATMAMLDGRRWVFALDGRLLQQIDRVGNVVAFNYDATLRVSGISDGLGRTLGIVYNAQSLVGLIQDHGGRIWRYGYDAAGNLSTVTDPLGGVTRYAWQAYRAQGDGQTYQQLLSETDAAGVVTVSYTYAGHKVASYTEGANRTTYTRVATNTTLLGAVTRLDSAGASSSYRYGDLGLITSETDALGRVTDYTYDGNGRRLRIVDAARQSWNATYDAQGRMLTSTNPLGETMTLAYSGTNPRPVTITSPSGRVVRLSYDSLLLLRSITDPSGAVTTIGYNAGGDATTITNALGQVWTLSFNATGLPLSVTDPLGRVTRATYDDLGRMVSRTNPAGEITRITYDALDRVRRVEDPLLAATLLDYDAAGRLLRVSDAQGSVTGFEYDAFGRQVAEVAPDGRRTVVSYRPDNLPAQLTWPDGSSIGYQYDAAKQLVSHASGAEATSLGWDVLGRLTSASGPGGTLALSYDDAGRVLAETQQGITLSSTYNRDGERISLAGSAIGSTSYTRDVRGLVTRITSPAGVFSLNHDALGRRTGLVYPNGSTVAYGFDAAGQLTSLTHAGAFNATLGYVYGAAGRIERLSGDGADWLYTYDAAGRLRQAAQGANLFVYPMDAVGNMLDNGRTHDLNHRLTADNSKSYGYDLRGNLVLEQDRASGARVVYAWNGYNQLRQLDFFANATDAAPQRTLRYAYDALGRRVSKQDQGLTSSVTERYHYDGADLAAVLDGAASAPQTAYVFSGQIDEPLAARSGAGNRFLYGNHLGSIVGVADGSTPTHTYRYGPYGETLAGSSADSVPFRYTGREKDAEGVYFYRARYYSPAMRRFTQSDPIGLAGGINTYSYVGGNPVSYVDPDGRIPIFPALMVVGGAAWAGYQGYQAGLAYGQAQCKTSTKFADRAADPDSWTPAQEVARRFEGFSNSAQVWGPALTRASIGVVIATVGSKSPVGAGAALVATGAGILKGQTDCVCGAP